MSLFPRVFASEFAPMFRLMDDYASHVATRGWPGQTRSTTFRSWQPRFDVKESKDAYELQGELPGIEQNELNIEFTDAQTLSVRGRTERSREQSTNPYAAIEGQTQQQQPEQIAAAPAAAESSETASTTSSSNYHKATVEDEGGANADDASITTATEGIATPATEAPAEPEPQQQVAAQQAPTNTGKYWLSERSIGEFQRRFEFPSRIDQDAVKASLRNGILSIVVPKAAAPVNRRVNVQ
ncbi:HSP20-like chaperone [Polychaeton citri CBS 116435]|uniref:HSP20-like chaperone n=1 Tax=Polychaeton citri CBS 116435 TaxID=1314669 RepID=A0A9P4Q339_9PEZI|nr:HSP20-like chaperone [Polychaeton citri CBS 116435]